MPIPLLSFPNLRRVFFAASLASLAIFGSGEARGANPKSEHWIQCGWGGGGFYYSAVFHPTQDGVIYMGGDVGGVYKTEDHGRNWRMINDGLAGYGVFSLAVDRMNPQTVYAATDSGLCKSTDTGEHWQLLPHTGPKELRITGEKGRSIRSIAVDPTDGKIVYAGSPGGKVYKSTDGGQAWTAVYSKAGEAANPSLLRVQFGKVNDQYFGGFWLPLKFPEDKKAADCVGFAFDFQGDKSAPKDVFLTLKTASGISYRSKNLRDLFADDQLRNVTLSTADFAIDAEFAKKHPEQAGTALDWATVNRMDFSSSGPLPQNASVARFGSPAFVFAAKAAKPAQVVVADFTKNKTVQSYGNIHLGDAAAGSVCSIAVSEKTPALVVAATQDTGLVMSTDAGKTWHALDTPKRASNVTFDPANPNILYGAFYKDGIFKSTDQGKTWTHISKDFAKDISIWEVAVSPANSLDVYAIGEVNWGGSFYISNDGGLTWKKSAKMGIDLNVNPTLQAQDGGKSASLSSPTNLTINPRNPKEIFVSANWRPCWSDDGGQTWTERVRRADISCITDIRFQGPRAYVTVMDEGTLVSDNGGDLWRQLWPRSYQGDLSGHNWRVAVTENNGVDRVLATGSPWGADNNLVIASDDGGKTYKVSKAGLPATRPRQNTMWGQGYARALAVDPANPKIVYLGIDGDPAGGENSGGGIFKSEDGGGTWKQLPNQPASRRMFFGLAVDPTDSKRVYWGACGSPGGGLHRSDDGGASWKQVFSNEQWIFNVHVAADGTVYCPGTNLWRSTDHGQTWKQLTKFNDGRTIIGVEVDPRDAKTVWISTCTWDNSASGAVYKTTDSGATWREMTGDIPYRKPMVLRFNPATNELWAGGVGLYKIKQ